MSNSKVIYLIGMMGVGKSSIGLGVAKWIGIEFYDLDQIIKQKEQMSVTQIFQQKGEKYFRDKEFQLLKHLSEELNSDRLISTGGGTPMHNNSMEYMNLHGDTIWLYVPIDIIIKRLKHSLDDRPIIQFAKQADFEPQVKQLYKSRESFYSQAKYKIDATGYDDEVIDKIIKIIGQQ